MAIPKQIKPQSLSDYLEIMTRAIFQAGVSWRLVETKWPAFRELFCNFDPQKVAKFSDADIDRLATDERILRSRKKIAATVANAQTLLQLDEEYSGFKNYLQSFATYEALSADMKRRFKFLGELSVYYLLFRVKEPVPNFDTWVQTIPGDHPRMREMVELAKKKTA